MMAGGSQDFDVHIPVGSLLGLYRNNIEDLQKFKPYLHVDPDLVSDFSERLSPFKGKKLIGLCWRSGMLSANRNTHYLAIDELTPLLGQEDCIFVNLQYGDCEEELRRVELQLGINIVRWDDVDLKNDQESVAAIISCLDAVVSAGTAVAQMAIAVGQKTILFGIKDWVYLGQTNYPWSNDVRSFPPDFGKPLTTIVGKIVNEIKFI
jgi:ADP-heptose:LPS heptosyltransferase